MAKKLSIQIKLEGGKEIKQELAEMGEAGKTAFDEINKAAKQAGGFDKLDPAKLALATAELKRLGVAAKEIDKVTAAVDRATRTERLVSTVRAVENGFSTLTSTVKLAALAFGPMGVVIGLVAEKAIAMVGALSGATEAINKTGEAAAKAGLSIAKYDKIRAALEKGGVSPEGIAGAIQKISEAADAAKIEKVAAAAKKLQDVMAAGSDVRTSPALQQLLTMAQGFGPVADAAKKALADLNINFTESEKRLQSMASSQTQSLQQLASGLQGVTVEGRAFASGLQQLRTGSDQVGAGLQAVVRQLEGIKDPAERARVAIQLLPQGGLEIAKGIQTGAISSQQSIDELTASIKTLDQTSLDLASKMEQSANRGAAAWERFKTTGDVSQLGVSIGEFFNRMSIATDQTSNALGPLIAKIRELAGSIGGAIWDTFASAGTTAINSVIAGIDVLINKFREAAAWVGKLFAGGGGTPGAQTPAPGMAGGGFVRGPGSSTSDSILARLSRGEYVMPASAVRQPGVRAFLEALRRGGSIPGFASGGSIGFSTPAGSVMVQLNEFAMAILEQYPLIQQMLDNLLAVLAETDDFKGASVKLKEFAEQWLGMKFARGGMIGGRGTGTSDSNLAWVSRGEHIMPAAIVRQPGVLALLEALRRGGNLSRLLDGMGRFALGGPVGMPALAGGGTGGMSHVTIAFPGLPAIGGLRASSAVVEELQRAAAMAQVRSGGRKPSRYT